MLVTIRSRAFLALWTIVILVAGTIGFIVFALGVAGAMDTERQRLSEVFTVHGAMWRTLVELKHDHRNIATLNLPSVREQRESARETVKDHLRNLDTLVRDPGQRDRLRRFQASFEQWAARWEAPADQSASPEMLLTLSENDFAPLEQQLHEFDRHQRQ
jgi:hypothetical protein